MQTEFCPLCSKNGAKVRVRAYQLNFEEAVFMCSTEECTWPVGYHELLFMDRPVGKYTTKDWTEMADQYLANYLKKQRDSISELSAYTPPQTPGNCKDTIHDSSTAGLSSLPTIKHDMLDPQPSTSQSKPFEIPVIDFVGDDDTPYFENGINSSDPVVGAKSEEVLVIMKDSSGITLTSKTDKFVANPFAKHSTLLVDKSVGIVDEKPNFGVSEKNVVSENILSKKFRILGKKKSKSFTYKKQFDIFDDIKKAKSTNEQCKAKVAIKSRIDLDKIKPNRIRDVLFVNNKSKVNDRITMRKVESIVNKGIKLESQIQFVKEEEKTSQADVNSTIKIEKKEPVASSLVQIINGDGKDLKVEGNVTLESLNKQSSNNDSAHYDLDTLMKSSPIEFESGESWAATDHNLENLLAMLEGDTSTDNLITVNDQLNHNPSTTNAILPSELNKDIDDLMIVNDQLNDTSLSEPLKDTDKDKNEKMEDDSVKKVIDIDYIIEDDTLQCSIEDTDDTFFASLFSPSPKPIN